MFVACYALAVMVCSSGYLVGEGIKLTLVLIVRGSAVVRPAACGPAFWSAFSFLTRQHADTKNFGTSFVSETHFFVTFVTKLSDDHQETSMMEESESDDSRSNNESDDSSIPSFVLDSDEEESNNQQFVVLQAVVATVAVVESQIRVSCYVRNRIEWDAHVKRLHDKSPTAFSRMYRMSHTSFQSLCSLLEPWISIDEKMAKVQTTKGPIFLAVVLHCLLHGLAGGSYLDIRLTAGISFPSFY